MFCEHSILGQELVKNELNNISQDFLYSKHNDYFGLTKTNILDYEGFAIWMESILCHETNNEKVWNKKKSIMSKDNITLLEYFQSSEEALSRYGLMAQMGFPKYQNHEKIVGVVKKLYANNFQNIDTIISYGSKKPYSDIDLFIVSNNPSRTYFNGWLDIYELNITDFEYLKNNLDISVTDPIFTGTQIYGQPKLEEYKKSTLNQNITPEAIAHRYKRVIQNNILTMKPRIDHSKLGYTYYHLYIELSEPSAYKKISEYYTVHPQCVFIMKYLGICDLHLELVLDPNKTQDIIDELINQFGNTLNGYELIKIKKEYIIHVH